MEIKVDVSNISLDSVIGTHYTQTGEDTYRDEPETLADVVAAQIALALQKDEEFKTLRARVLDLRNEEIREQVKPIVAAAIAAPVQRTNSYGSPVGEPVPLTELIVKEARDVLTKRDGYGRDSLTLVQKIIRDEVDRAIKHELADIVAEEKAKVVAAVRAKAADLIATAVREGVGR